MRPSWNGAVLAAVLFAGSGIEAGAAGLEEAQSAAGALVRDARLERAGYTALQKHIAFFDKNGDGVITRAETEQGLRELGLGRLKAAATALVIHAALGPKTTGNWRSLDISVKDIKLAKHGSDTGAFDAEGRFVPEAFERMFAEFDLNRSGSLSEAELETMIEADARLRPGNKTASTQEFQLLLLIAADTTEVAGGKTVRAISRARLRQFYDGTLFYELAKP